LPQRLEIDQPIYRRVNLLSDLYRLLEKNNYALLIGDNKVGKTTLVHSFYRVYSINFDIVWYIDSSSVFSIKNSFRELQNKLQLNNTKDNLLVNIELISQYLSRSQYRTLIVFDNIHVPFSVVKRFSVECSSRVNCMYIFDEIKFNDNSIEKNSQLHIRKFDSGEAVGYLKSILKEKKNIEYSDDNICEICTLFNNTPQYLYYVSNYIFENGLNTSDFISIYNYSKYINKPIFSETIGIRNIFEKKKEINSKQFNYSVDSILLLLAILDNIHISLNILTDYLTISSNDLLDNISRIPFLNIEDDKAFLPHLYQNLLLETYDDSVIHLEICELLKFFHLQFMNKNIFYNTLIYHLSNINLLMERKELITEEYLKITCKLLKLTVDNIRYKNSNYKKTLEYFSKIEEHLVRFDMNYYIVKIKRYKAYIYIDTGDYAKTKLILNDAVILAKCIRNYSLLNDVYKTLCIYFWHTEEMSQALKYSRKIITSHKLHFVKVPSVINNMHALYLYNLGYIKRAHNLFLKVYKAQYASKLDPMFAGSGEIFNNISETLFELGDHKTSFENFKILLDYYSTNFSSNIYLALDEHINIIKVHIYNIDYTLAYKELKILKDTIIGSNRTSMDLNYLSRVYIYYGILSLIENNLKAANEFYQYACELNDELDLLDNIDSEYKFHLIKNSVLKATSPCSITNELLIFAKKNMHTDVFIALEAMFLIIEIFINSGNIAKAFLYSIRLVISTTLKYGFNTYRLRRLFDQYRLKK